MKLHEIKPLREDAYEKAIVKWLDLAHVIPGKFDILSNGKISVFQGIVIQNSMLDRGKLPYQFENVDGFFNCQGLYMTSFEGFPRKINGYCNCNGIKITSLEGVADIIEEMYGVFFCDDLEYLKTGGLGLLLIKGITGIYTNHHALEIINKYIPQGEDGIFDCQHELIEKGYEEFAKI